MINYKKAEKILNLSAIKIGNEKISGNKSLNRVVVENIYSPVNYPSGNNTAFDGFAVVSNNTIGLSSKKTKKFKILKTIAAGDDPKINNFQKFSTIEVMTGALIPKPFNTVIPIENINFYSNQKNFNHILIKQRIKKNEHIRFMGSDYKKGELVISAGEIIQEAHILAFKTLGIEQIKVKKKPVILFYSTGNEITNKKKIQNWKVRNSNTHYIGSLSNNFLFTFINGGILRDKDEKLFEKILIKNLKSKIDIIITSGAVSAGKYDFVPKVIKKLNTSNYFKGVAIRPGKPILFAKFKNKSKAFFGLPGNPISSAACFRFFVYPYLSSALNIKKEESFKAKLKNNFSKKKPFTRFLKGKLSSNKKGFLELEILKGQESYKIKSFTKSNVWALFKSGQSFFKKGELIPCFHPSFDNKKIFF